MRDALNFEGAAKEANRCLLCEDAPCSKGCPAGTDPGKFIRQIRFENIKGAARTIMNNNIMGSTCSFVCPTEKLCEKECSIKALEDPINISGLQRYACEQARSLNLEKFKSSKKTKGKVAIIGAGPAGIGAATELAKNDYDVTIFEKESSSGGVPNEIIPEYRLPREAIEYDMQNLANLGVEIKYNTKIETSEQLSGLSNQGYQAIFVSTGLSEPFQIPTFSGFTNAINYNTFLHNIKNGNKPQIEKKNVVIIGGGSVAMDAACSAAALGAKKVYAISLESLAELPADEEEIELAHNLHIMFKTNSVINDVVSDGDKITGIKGQEIEWKIPGKFTPDNAEPIKGTEFNLNVDLIIIAIGTKPGKEILQLGFETKGKGTILINDNCSTNIPGIFAGGDISNGGTTVVQAVADGKLAASSIMNYIEKGE